MKTHHSIPSIALLSVTVLALGLLTAPSAHALELSRPQVEIQAKFVEVSRTNLTDLGFEWVRDFNTSVSRQIIQPNGSSPLGLGTFPVNPPGNLPQTGDIRVWLSTDILKSLPDSQFVSQPRVTTRSAQQAVGSILRDLNLKVTPRVSSDRSTIALDLVPEVREFTNWSVDAFGTVAFGRVEGSERTTRDVTVNGKRVVSRPETVLVPFDNGQQIVNREETRYVQTEEKFQRTEQVSETRDFNRLGDVAGGGGLRVNYMFNPNWGVNVRGEVLGGRDTLGLVTGSIFGEYPCRWPVTPTYSLGGGVIFPDAEAVMDVGLGLKRNVAPGVDLFSEAHLITNFGGTTFGEFNIGARFAIGRRVTTNVNVGDGQTTVIGGGIQPRDRVPVLGRIPVVAHLFRKRGEAAETRNLLIFVTPRIVLQGEPE